MVRHTSMRASWVASGLLLIPLNGLAQSGVGTAATEGTAMQGDNFARPTSVQMSPPSSAARPGNQSGTVRNVNNTFRDTVAGNCSYTASVRGTVREVTVPGATADNAVQFRPHLQIRSQLSCPDGSARQVSSFTLEGAQYGREQLAQTIADHARIFVNRDGRVCSYAPRLAFDRGQLASNGVGQSCTMPRGGGPQDRSRDQPSPFMGRGLTAPPPGLGDGGARTRPPIGGGPRDTIDQTDTMQGQHGVDPRTNPAFAAPPSGLGGTGRDVTGTPRSQPQDVLHNPVLMP